MVEFYKNRDREDRAPDQREGAAGQTGKEVG